MKSIWYHLELVATSACNKGLMEGTKGLGQSSLKGPTRDFFLFDSWLLSKKPEGTAVSIGVYLIGIVKNNTKGFCKATIEGLTKDWPGGSYIVLRSKPIVPGERPIIDIVYKYNPRRSYHLLLQWGQVSLCLVLLIYQIILTKFLMSQFSLFLLPISCLFIVRLMRWTHTTSRSSHILRWRSYG